MIRISRLFILVAAVATVFASVNPAIAAETNVNAGAPCRDATICLNFTQKLDCRDATICLN